MIDPPEVDYLAIAYSLLRNDKSKQEVIDQLVALGMEEFSAQALLDRLLVPQEMKDSEHGWRMIALGLGISSIILSIGIGFTFSQYDSFMQQHNILVLVIGPSIVGLAMIVYGIRGV